MCRLRLLVVVLAVMFIAPSARADAPTSEREPNVYGDTGIVRSSSARIGAHELQLGLAGFGFYAADFVGPGADKNSYLGGHASASLALFEAVQLSVATRAAANINSVAGTQASVGDLMPSLKAGYRFLPLAFAVNVRAMLPTRSGESGFQFDDSALNAQLLLTFDLKDGLDIPLRAHLNAGYTYQVGKGALGDKQKVFEQNPYYLDGVSGQLLALPTQQWFYDAVALRVAIEAPLPYATPFVEASYETALGVPKGRGVKGAGYSLLSDAHVIVTPGVRVTPGLGVAVLAAVDIGLTNNGGGLAVDVTQLVSGQPVNPLWVARLGVSHSFDLFGSSGTGAGRGTQGQVRGCVTDAAGGPVTFAVVDAPALAGVRVTVDDKGCFTTPALAAGDVTLDVSAVGFTSGQTQASVKDGETTTANVVMQPVPTATTTASSTNPTPRAGTAAINGYVTNKDDDVLDAELTVTDARGSRSAGKTVAGAFDVEVSTGRVWLSAQSERTLARGVEVVLEAQSRARTTLVLRPVPKKRSVTLGKDDIAVSARIPFEYKKPRLQSTAEYLLDEVVDVLLKNPALKVRVDVYAEPLATPEEGQKLADERAQTVVDYLAVHGVPRTRLEAKGVPNIDEKSRRVDFKLVP